MLQPALTVISPATALLPNSMTRAAVMKDKVAVLECIISCNLFLLYAILVFLCETISVIDTLLGV